MAEEELAELVGNWIDVSCRGWVRKLNHFYCEGDCIWNFASGILLAIQL